MTVVIMDGILISCLSLVVVLLIVGSNIGNAIMMVHQVSVENTTIITNSNINNKSLSSYTTSSNSTINIGPPHKVTIPFNSQQQQPTALSAEKKQQLMQSHPKSTPLPSSGKPTQRPIPGTQTSMP